MPYPSPRGVPAPTTRDNSCSGSRRPSWWGPFIILPEISIFGDYLAPKMWKLIPGNFKPKELNETKKTSILAGQSLQGVVHKLRNRRWGVLQMITVLHRSGLENKNSNPRILGYFIRNIISIDLTKNSDFCFNWFLGVWLHYYMGGAHLRWCYLRWWLGCSIDFAFSA